jgi:hypothetical protein
MGEMPSPFDEEAKMVGTTGFKKSRAPGVKGKKKRTRRLFSLEPLNPRTLDP